MTKFSILHSDSYSRTCDSANNCEEEYQNCRTEITDASFLVEKATGEPAKVSIPLILCLRRSFHFNASLTFSVFAVSMSVLYRFINCYRNLRLNVLSKMKLKLINLMSLFLIFQVYAECIPAVDALRDQCNSTFTCSSDFAYKRGTDELTYCRIECTAFDMTCFNYTRNCSNEVIAIFCS